MTTRCDVLVVGSGPAGMAASTRLAQAGVNVVVIDEQASPGGQIWRDVEADRDRAITAALGAEYRKGAGKASAFRAAGVTYRHGEQLWQLEAGWRAFTSSNGKASTIDSDAVILATGAQERPAPFPGWTLPGVMTVGAAQILLKTAAQIPEEPVWIAGSGPLVYLYINQLLGLGGKIAGFIDTAPSGNIARTAGHAASLFRQWRQVAKGLKWIADIRRSGIPVYRNLQWIEAVGTGRLEAIRFQCGSGREMTVPAKLLLVHEGLVPSIHTTLSLGCAHDWHEDQQCYVPRLDEWTMTSVGNVFVAGDGSGIAGADAALSKGEISALGALVRLGRLTEADAQRQAAPFRKDLARHLGFRRFLDALYPPRPQIFAPSDDTIACRCEELTVADIRATARSCRGGPDQVKAQTRAGMGPCQGRQCGYTVGRIIAQEYEIAAKDVGFYRIRPPLKPIRISELATLQGELERK